MRSSACAILLAACVAYAEASLLSSTTTPLTKVVELLTTMEVKGEKAKKEEAIQHSSFQQFCVDTSEEKNHAIQQETSAIERLTAVAAKAESDSTVAADEITSLQAEIVGWEADHKSAKEVRTKEKADASETRADYTESISAVQRAIKLLKAQSGDRKQSPSKESVEAALLSVRQSKAPVQMQKLIRAAFVQSREEPAADKLEEDFLSRRAPEANGYEFQSGGVITMLEKLERKFVAERNTADKEEAQSQHSFDLISQDLQRQIAAATRQVEKKTVLKAKHDQLAASSSADVAATKTATDEDTKYLKDLTNQCLQKKKDFASRTELRTQELKAIAEAKKVLGSSDIQDAAKKHLPAAVKASSFLQLRSSIVNAQAKQAQIRNGVFAMLSTRAASADSALLSMMAKKAQSDPFEKVKEMISTLLERLENEASKERGHHQWCEHELATNKNTRAQKTEETDALAAEIDNLKASIARLGEEIGENSAALVALDSAVKKGTASRIAEKKENAETVAEAKAAQVALTKAVVILREFYNKASEATALVQSATRRGKKSSPMEDAPEIFDGAYKGMQAEHGGVVGLLEVILSDFSMLEGDAAASEAEAANAHQKFLNVSRLDSAVKKKVVEQKTLKKGRLSADLASKSKDFRATSDELAAANNYYDKLKPSCLISAGSFEERKERREEEIQSLKEALEMLEGSSAN